MKRHSRRHAKRRTKQQVRDGNGRQAAAGPKSTFDDDRFDSVGATPETRARLEEDPLHRMAVSGMIDSAGERAAEEIKCVFLAICRDVIGKTMRPSLAYARGKFEIPDDLASAHAQRYLPWCRAHRRQIVEATIDLVVERKPPRSGLLLDGVADALADYARRFDSRGGAGDDTASPARTGAGRARK